MALANRIDSTQELLEAQAHVWNHTFSYINCMSLKCAIQLGIPDVLYKHGKAMTLSELANALPINKAKFHGLYRLMRILTHSKFFDKVKIFEGTEEEAYCLTQASHLLLRDEPMSIAPFTLAMLDPFLIDPWHHMSEWFQNESQTPFVTKHGRTLWGYLGIDQSCSQLFSEGMASDARFVTNILVKEGKHVFEGLKTMVDIGGGTGMVAKTITATFPGLKCTVLDLPHVIAGLEGADNLTYVAGDMFEFIPQADAVFLKWIIHAWSDEESIKLLKRCKEAIDPSKDNGGKVIIVEMVVDDQKQEHQATETQLFFDMLMMTVVKGKERTEKEWANIFFAAGFTSYKITLLLGLRSIIEVFP